MTTLARRAHPRIICEADIQYAPAEEKDLVESRAFNFSRGGMYLETPEWFPTNTFLRILMNGYEPHAEGPEAFQSYLANIRWRQEVQGNGGRIYGLGVQFLERHHGVLERPVRVEWVNCDVCNDFVKRSETRLTDDLVRICQGCRTDLGCLPDGKLNDCIQRYLSGNIF